MDWKLAVEKNRERLTAIIAVLVASLGRNDEELAIGDLSPPSEQGPKTHLV